MRIFLDHAGLPADARGAVAAIGNFDGVHLGHRAVIAQAAEIARASRRPFGILTFEPHARSYFRPLDPPFRLTPAPVKRRLIAGLGCDVYYELRFDERLARLEAGEFVSAILDEALGLRHLVAGEGFVFGRGRGGNVALLRGLAPQHGFAVSLAEAVQGPGGQPCSSTRIRELLVQGKPEQAADLLGRAWSVAGVVLSGDKRGRQLGFPTANIELGEYLAPARGVYAVRVGIPGIADPLGGVANFGLRPTIGGDKALLEVHLFDFSGDLYGRMIEIELLAYLRPEQRFPGLDALRAQIAADSAAARALLARQAAPSEAK
jgi:riboflavin kinase/FMN adenylyltransferase